MSNVNSRIRWMWRRAVLAYHLMCAREDARIRGLRTPRGIWLCSHCRLVLWDRRAFVVHAVTHPG